MFAPLHHLFGSVVKGGNLRITDATGRPYEFGDGTGPPSAVRIKDRRTEISIALNPRLALGEAYIDGRLIVEAGDLYHFLDILLRGAEHNPVPAWVDWLDKLYVLFRRFDEFNPVARARRNAAHHYDIETEVYKYFLDSDWQYSCAYFETPDAGLEEAQRAKKRHLAAKLLVRPGDKVLDIGCGWGGLAIYLAEVSDAEVSGITLSQNQLKIARKRAQNTQKPDRLSFRLEDYRNTQGRYDKIVSVGMFEHVGPAHYKSYFERVRDLLSDDGIAVIHSIGRFDGPYPTNPFIKKYIFPGGSVPALSEVLPFIEASGLKICDVEILRLHYAKTLRHWRRRFNRRWDEASELKGENFCRLWEFYLAGFEASFKYQGLMVFQLQLAQRQSAVPLTRDYMLDEKRMLAQAENAGYQPEFQLPGETLKKTG